ncbi:WD40-repeat-containing domain protein, partial [Mycena vulgaris]
MWFHSIEELLALGQDDKHLESLKLKHAKSKRGHQECLEDTRADVLKSIEDWIDDVDGPNLFWLHGHPGTGKSAIATTVRNRLESAKRLGSCFFFRREDFTVQTPESLWCSVGYDLAQQCPSIRQVVLEQSKLHSIDPDVSDYTTILNHLLGAILGVLLPTYPEKLPVIVIDALDECGGREQPRSYQRKLLLALSMWQSHSKQLKILVTSRDEGDIRRVLGQGGLTSRVLEVGRNVSGTSSSDIKTFFKYRFHEIRQMFMIKEPWPTELQLQSLTDTAAGLFIWASTVVSLVEDGPPVAQLARALKMSTPRSGGTDTLAHLYQEILSSKFIDPLQISLFITVAGTILVARTPLSLEDLAQLFPELETTDVGWACNQLKSVLDVQSGVHFVHQSFVDFLVTHPTDSKFYLNKEHHERRFAAACFSAMKALHFNMGNIETSYLRNDDIPGLRDRIPNHLKYSCQFWATHLENSGAGEFSPNIFTTFMKSQLLYWLEVISIEQMLGTAAESLAALSRWGAELKRRANDALTFLRCFGTPISTSVPHIYLSAVVFAPQNSVTRETYLHTLPGVLKLNTGGDMVWSSLQGVLKHHQIVSSVAFSPDGQHIVSGSQDSRIHIWAADSQGLVGDPLRGHIDWVTSVAYSHDGRYIVSGSKDGTVCVWDVENNRQPIGEPLRGHTNKVLSTAFSPDGRHIISGSMDSTLRMWDTETRQQIGELLHSHFVNVTSVTFSPNGRYILSGSTDCAVQIWDARSQQQVGEPLYGHTDAVTSVGWSPDGTQIISGSEDQTVFFIWDIESQQQVGEPLRGHDGAVSSVEFSPDGRHIVSGSWDNTIRIWNVESRQQVGKPLHGHDGWVLSVAFSPDSRHIISGSSDATLRIW